MPLRFITTLVVSSLGLLTWGAAHAGAQTPTQVTSQATTSSTVYQPGNGITNPVPIHQESPRYPSGFANSAVQGSVTLEVVILANGTVGQVTVKKGLDSGAVTGLDAEAVAAAKRWLFRPATRNGQPVPVYSTLILTFQQGGEGAPVPQAFADAYPPTTAGLVPPRVLTSVEAKYTSDAMRQKLQGEVVVEVVVDKNGFVSATRIVKPLDPDLDRQAEEAAKSWTFAPATLNGQPVLARVPLILTFRIH